MEVVEMKFVSAANGGDGLNRHLEEKCQCNSVAFAWTGNPFPSDRIDFPTIVAMLPRTVSRDLAGVFDSIEKAWPAR
jgi:hypothetical protein